MRRGGVCARQKQLVSRASALQPTWSQNSSPCNENIRLRFVWQFAAVYKCIGAAVLEDSVVGTRMECERKRHNEYKRRVLWKWETDDQRDSGELQFALTQLLYAWHSAGFKEWLMVGCGLAVSAT